MLRWKLNSPVFSIHLYSYANFSLPAESEQGTSIFWWFSRDFYGADAHKTYQIIFCVSAQFILTFLFSTVNRSVFKMKYLFVFWLLVAVCKLKNTQAICWETGCHLDSWAVRGCQQYGMIEKGQRPCPSGIIFSCCEVNQTSILTNNISQKCLDTGY